MPTILVRLHLNCYSSWLTCLCDNSYISHHTRASETKPACVRVWGRERARARAIWDYLDAGGVGEAPWNCLLALGVDRLEPQFCWIRVECEVVLQTRRRYEYAHLRRLTMWSSGSGLVSSLSPLWSVAAVTWTHASPYWKSIPTFYFSS